MNISAIAKPISHLIFELPFGSKLATEFVYKDTIPYMDNDNRGLPGSFFEGDFINFVLDDAGFVEWIPGCGPAPCWKARYADFKNHDEMLIAWNTWYEATY